MEIFTGVNLGDVISFDLHDQVKAIVPTNFDDVVAVGTLDSDSAKAYLDPWSMHRNIYPVLPQGTCPDDPTAYYYLKVKLSNGRYTAVGLPWINNTTIEKRDSTTALITVDNVSSTDLKRLKDHLAAGGWYLVDAKMV